MIYELGMGYPANGTFPMLSVIKDAMLGKSSPIEVPLTHPVLLQNYPNPFNPTTVVSFELPASSATTLKIYDVIGQQVATLVDGSLSAGTHTVSWDGAGHASGIYLAVLRANGEVMYHKMLYLR